MTRLAAASTALGLALWALGAPPPAGADVPRACVHPRSDPIECPRQWRREYRDVLPLARLRALEAQRPRLRRVAPREDRVRNRLLLEILRSQRCSSC